LTINLLNIQIKKKPTIGCGFFLDGFICSFLRTNLNGQLVFQGLGPVLFIGLDKDFTVWTVGFSRSGSNFQRIRSNFYGLDLVF
jgi:hypothetical protein